ncbi:MAG: DUF5666 domain-containing protein [Candidatus Thiodiazotropha taylori]|nr:DUF5666 domain-containing protein [Candidatus Thiodiazotropha endolucinida]MCW4229129.1 DUF5666 domain-containing protein [Candidatus Thiodiazotropha taylori]
MRSSLKPKILYPLLISCLTLTACGGGGGGESSSTSDSSITARGAITGFGSVYVNGVRYHTNSTEFTVDDSPGAESDLRLGMVVTVTATLNDDNTGNASSIVFDNELQGPVANLVSDSDGQTKTFTLLGVSVTVDRVGTSFHDTTFDSLANGDLVEVSGFYDGSLVLNATFLENKERFTAGVSEIELKGTVSNSTAESFQINGITIHYDPDGISTDLSRLTGTLSDGDLVEVKGTLGTNDEIQATRIAHEDGALDDSISKVSLEGIITDYVDDSNFRISGRTVDASTAVFSPASLTLANGIKVEAEGPIVEGTLEALTIEARGGGGTDIEIDAHVDGVSSEDNSITLRLSSGSVTVFVDNRTRMEDKTKAVESLSLTDLASGDFIEVRGLLDGSSQVVLTELRRDDADDLVLQGPVEDFTANSSITILGVTFFTSASTQFEDINDSPISAESFYNSLSLGSLVKIKDDEPGNGSADEVEFED